jgi:hypothetical protein
VPGFSEPRVTPFRKKLYLTTIKEADEFKGNVPTQRNHPLTSHNEYSIMRKCFFSVKLVIALTIFSCDIDKETEFHKLEKNLDSYKGILSFIEREYNNRLLNSKAPRIVFLKCADPEKNIEDYVCDDSEVLEFMESLDIAQIRFERNGCKNSLFSEVYFQTSKMNHYPIVYYLYERCGAGVFFESSTIYYKPVDDNWGLLIDSSFP